MNEVCTYIHDIVYTHMAYEFSLHTHTYIYVYTCVSGGVYEINRSYNCTVVISHGQLSRLNFYFDMCVCSQSIGTSHTPLMVNDLKNSLFCIAH